MPRTFLVKKKWKEELSTDNTNSIKIDTDNVIHKDSVSEDKIHKCYASELKGNILFVFTLLFICFY